MTDTPKVVRDIVERVTVMRDEATVVSEEIQNLWTGRDIRGTINELLLTAMVSRVHTLDDVLAAIEAETGDAAVANLAACVHVPNCECHEPGDVCYEVVADNPPERGED